MIQMNKMLLESATAEISLSFLGLIVTLALVCGTHNRYAYGLHHIPGPFFASLTEWWRLILVLRRRPELTHIHLHEKYGDVVRIGPQTVIVRDPEGVKKIYALNAGYIKVRVFLLTISS